MSPEEVAQAVALHNDGRSIRYIANLLGIPRSTVSDAIQRFRETGSYARRPGQGRRRATNAAEDRFLRLQSLREGTLPATALSRRLADVHGTVISSDTVLRRLRKHNLTSHPSATGPRLNAEHRRQRLEFARMHADWGMDEWCRVLFTDESRFTRYSPDHRQRVFRRPGERYAQCCFASRVPFGGGGVMIWGGISLAVCTALVTLRRGSINADRYIRGCLEEHVVSFAPFLGVDFLQIHDNA
jgi:transposase